MTLHRLKLLKYTPFSGLPITGLVCGRQWKKVITPERLHRGLHCRPILKWINAVVKHPRSTGFEFYPLCEYFNSLMAMGKLLTTNVNPLDPGDYWIG